MKVILNQDIDNLGEEGDIKDVAAGFARNYLIPQKLAVSHTKQNLVILESRRTIIEKKKEDKRSEALSLKEKLAEEEIVLTMPAGDSGKLFGSVNSAMISEELDKKGYAIEKRKIEIPDKHIRMIGEHTVLVKLYGNEKADIKLKIEKAEEKK